MIFFLNIYSVCMYIYIYIYIYINTTFKCVLCILSKMCDVFFAQRNPKQTNLDFFLVLI